MNVHIQAVYGERRATIHTVYVLSADWVGRAYTVTVDDETHGTHVELGDAKDEAEKVVGVSLTWEAK